MAQWLRVLVVLPEVLSLILTTLMEAQNHLQWNLAVSSYVHEDRAYMYMNK